MTTEFPPRTRVSWPDGRLGTVVERPDDRTGDGAYVLWDGWDGPPQHMDPRCLTRVPDGDGSTPQFERGFYLLTRDLVCATRMIPGGVQVFVPRAIEGDHHCMVESTATSGWASAAALAAAGAVRVEEDRS